MKLRTLILLIAASVIAAACGGGSSTTSSDSNVSVAMSGSSDPVGSGSDTVLSITVSNNGTARANNVVLTPQFGQGLTLKSVACVGSVGGTCSGTSDASSITIASLPPQASITFQITASVAAGMSGDIANSVSANADGSTAASTSNFVIHAYTADVGVAATAETASIVNGGSGTYTVTLTNAGPDTAASLTLANTLSSNLTLGTVSCAASGGAVCPGTLGGSMQVRDLPKDGKLIFTLTAALAADGNESATLTAAAQASGDMNSADNTATAASNTEARNSVTLQSDTGDFIGAGQSYSYDQSNAQLSVTANGGHLTISVHGDEQWTGDVALPSADTQLVAGTYANLTRYPFDDPATGGLNWSGEGRGCNTLTGSVTINSVTYTSGALTAVDLSFVQHCEGASAALHGQIHWTANDNSQPAGPVQPVPSGLWDAPASALPTSGNYIYLESESGDYIGAGSTYLYQPGSGGTISVTANGKLLQVNVNTADTWSGDFQAMNVLSQLQQGYYGDLERYPFNNPVTGGLSWSGNGRGCNTLTGWFAVDSIAYSGTALQSVDLRFEQHCEGGGPALHGKIHWQN
jgi:uncharacterized repeat protein (TIGR01451 family)